MNILNRHPATQKGWNKKTREQQQDLLRKFQINKQKRSKSFVVS